VSQAPVALPEPHDWLCRNGACRFPLGQLDEQGALTLYARVTRVTRHGCVQVVCPRCQCVKVFYPDQSPLVQAGAALRAAAHAR
jgi:hypothetical protein